MIACCPGAPPPIMTSRRNAVPATDHRVTPGCHPGGRPSMVLMAGMHSRYRRVTFGCHDTGAVLHARQRGMKIQLSLGHLRRINRKAASRKAPNGC